MSGKVHWIEIEEGTRWQLIRGSLAICLGSVQCFNTEGGAYYGTWDDMPGRPGGRTGAVGDLNACKRMVEERALAS